MHHNLKICPQYFQPVRERKKTFEVRVNDRAFQAGDTVTLREFKPEYDVYTGAEETFVIGYVLPIQGMDKVVFSLIPEENKP